MNNIVKQEMNSVIIVRVMIMYVCRWYSSERCKFRMRSAGARCETVSGLNLRSGSALWLLFQTIFVDIGFNFNAILDLSFLATTGAIYDNTIDEGTWLHNVVTLSHGSFDKVLLYSTWNSKWVWIRILVRTDYLKYVRYAKTVSKSEIIILKTKSGVK